MGTPKQLYKFSVREMHDALSLAKDTAMNFRSLDARIKALDHLKVSLLPMVEWLDKPLKECFPGPGGRALDGSKKRALPLFGQFGGFSPVALTRKGAWVTLTPHDTGVMDVSSRWLALAVCHWRYNILGAIPRGHKKESVVIAESMGMSEVVEYCAFLKYLALGMKELDEMLEERENRLRTVRHNFSLLKSFTDGIDPLEYGAPESSLPGYAVFDRHSRGASRCSGTYLVSGPAEKEVAEGNKKKSPESDSVYYIHEDGNRRFRKLDDFLSRVRCSIDEVSESGQFARKPLSDEEKKVITDFVRGIGISSK